MKLLSYKKIGKGKPLVLVHGYLGGPDMGKFQEELKDHFELIMPSLPGYGESAFMRAPSTIRDNAVKVFELLDALGIETFYLLGHSMGGMITQEMAVLFPERVKKLICFGTGSIGVLPNRFETIEESRNKIKEKGIKETRENIAKTWFVDYLLGDGYQLCLDEGAKATTQAALASLDACKLMASISIHNFFFHAAKHQSGRLNQISVALKFIRQGNFLLLLPVFALSFFFH